MFSDLGVGAFQMKCTASSHIVNVMVTDASNARIIGTISLTNNLPESLSFCDIKVPPGRGLQAPSLADRVKKLLTVEDLSRQSRAVELKTV